MDRLHGLLARHWLGASGLQWFIALVIVFGATPLLLVARRLLAARLRQLADRTRTDLDDFVVGLVERTRGWFLTLLALRGATLVFDLPERWDHRAQIALVIGGMVQGGLWAGALVGYLVDRRFARHLRADDQVTPVAQTLLRFAGLMAVWSVVLLATLSSFGVDITALVAGLGVGGVAVALAVQKLLGDVLASISIALDKPFVPGDYIAVGDQQGTVHRIGMRSTVIGGLGGEELVVSNNDLLSSRISNFTRMRERRVVFKVGVPYETAEPLLAALPALLRAQIDGREQVRFDRAALTGLGAASVEFEVVYWMTTAETTPYVQTHQQILLAVVSAMRAAGYELVPPGRTTYVVSPDARAPTVSPQQHERAPARAGSSV
jgi:small-conductance mechanosensitive channel